MVDLTRTKPSKNLSDRRPQNFLQALVRKIQQELKMGPFDSELQYDIEEKRRQINNSIGEPFMNQFIDKKRKAQNIDPNTGLYDIEKEVNMILIDVFSNPENRARRDLFKQKEK